MEVIDLLHVILQSTPELSNRSSEVLQQSYCEFSPSVLLVLLTSVSKVLV